MRKIIVLLAYVPSVYLLTFYLLVARVALKTGKFPEYGNPDPKSAGFDTHRVIAYKLFDITIYSVIAVLILFLLNTFVTKVKVRRLHLMVFAVTVAIFCLHIFIDPFFVWSVD
jgi:hypothetical protein